MNTKTISLAQLRDILAAKKGATFVTISALTDARCVKKNRDTKEPIPFASVSKLSVVNGTINADYETSVNRQLAREGKSQLSFTAKPRAWGTRIDGTPLVEHKGRFYLSILPRFCRKPIYLGKQAGGFLQTVAKEALAPFLPLDHSSADAQGVDREVVTRDYALDGIGSLSIDGQRYRVRQSA